MVNSEIPDVDSRQFGWGGWNNPGWWGWGPTWGWGRPNWWGWGPSWGWGPGFGGHHGGHHGGHRDDEEMTSSSYSYPSLDDDNFSDDSRQFGWGGWNNPGWWGWGPTWGWGRPNWWGWGPSWGWGPGWGGHHGGHGHRDDEDLS